MKHYIITIFAMLALSVGSASCSEDEPLQGTGQQTTPNNGNNNSGNNNNNNENVPVSNNLKINTWREDKFERSVANGTETVFVTLRFCVVRKQLKATLKPNAAGVQLPPHYYRNG